KHIDAAINVVVAYALAQSTAARADAGGRGHVLELAVALVAIEMNRRCLARRKPFERRSVDEKQIEVAVVVEVDERHARAGRLEQILVRRRAAEDDGTVEPGFARDVRERERRRVLLRRGG